MIGWFILAPRSVIFQLYNRDMVVQFPNFDQISHTYIMGNNQGSFKFWVYLKMMLSLTSFAIGI